MEDDIGVDEELSGAGGERSFMRVSVAGEAGLEGDQRLVPAEGGGAARPAVGWLGWQGTVGIMVQMMAPPVAGSNLINSCKNLGPVDEFDQDKLAERWMKDRKFLAVFSQRRAMRLKRLTPLGVYFVQSLPTA